VFKRKGGDSADGACNGDAGMVIDSSRSSSSQWVLVATGSLMNIEPDRIILKKVKVYTCSCRCCSALD